MIVCREPLRRLLRHALRFGVALALLAPVPASAAKQPDAKPEEAAETAETEERPTIGYYATTVGRSHFEIVIVQYWSKGAKFRSETVVAGHPIITLVRGDEYYCWDELTGEGYVVKRTPQAIAAEAGRERPFGMELQELIDEGGEQIRSETLNGVRVHVYRVTDGDGKRTLWVDADRLDLPVRLETYSRATGRTGHLDWINWIPGLVISDAFFEPPEGRHFVRFDSYEEYLQRLGRGPIPPAPPLFHYLLHDRGGAAE